MDIGSYLLRPFIWLLESISKLMAVGKPVPQNGPESIRIDFKKRSAKMRLWVADFIDNGHVVAYIPSLKLTAYGQTKEEAIDMLFSDVVNDMFEQLMTLDPNAILMELKRYGWKQHKYFHKEFTNTPFVDKDGILRDFNLPRETKVNTGFHNKTAAVVA